MGKFIDGGISPDSFGPGPVVCPAGQATAWDEWTGACFKIYGLGITIGDTADSDQGGFEIFNANIHMDGTQRALVSNYQLEGPTNV